MNPLSPDESDLVSLSTGTVAPPVVVKDLLRALVAKRRENLDWFTAQIERRTISEYITTSTKG